MRSLSIDQAACRLCVARRTIYNMIRDGRLHTVRTMGGSQRVLGDSIVAYEEMKMRQQLRRERSTP